MKRILLILSVALLAGNVALAQIRLPKVITDNMVLQREKPVKIWGEAMPGENVQVVFMKQKKSAVADAAGRWSVVLDPMNAVKNPQSMTIKAGKEKVVLENILVGEVWLASGQSNMEYSMNNHPKHPKPKKGDKE